MALPKDTFPANAKDLSPEQLTQVTLGRFPGLLGIEFLSVGDGSVRARMPVREDLLAPNGFLHAGSVVGFADTACGFGARLAIPDGALGFTTVELKSNFLGTATEGAVVCDAHLVHGGRSTQVWDATVTDEASKKTIALFRLTQLVLWPR
jgi:1,4-dihydroxy-2-naphthoyl-CoA hydrolase